MTTFHHPARHAACALVAAALAWPAAQAASPAASSCPDYFFLSDNLALNPGFETPTAGTAAGAQVCWQAGDPPFPSSAAADWQMHSSNGSATVCSRLVHSSVPGPGGAKMLEFKAGSNEGGVYRNQALDPRRADMFSVWVKVRSGQVAIQSRSVTGGPVAWTSKTGEWEQLRVCTNSLIDTNQLVIFNQAAGGGTFYVDRVELREIPIRE